MRYREEEKKDIKTKVERIFDIKSTKDHLVGLNYLADGFNSFLIRFQT